MPLNTLSKELMNEIQIRDFNSPDGELPYIIVEPTSEGKIVWVCGKDEEERVTSVYVYQGKTRERQIAYLPNIEEAKRTRDILLQNGWFYGKAPTLEFRDSNGNMIPVKRV